VTGSELMFVPATNIVNVMFGVLVIRCT